MNQIQLAIARAVNAPIPVFNPEEQIRKDAEARKHREMRRVEQFIHKQWLAVPAAGLPHEVKPMLAERFERLLGMLDMGMLSDDRKHVELSRSAYNMVCDRGLQDLPPLRLQTVLAGYR